MSAPAVHAHVASLFNAGVFPGWCPLEKARQLVDLVFELTPSVVLETGVFGGKSLFPMALACKDLGRGKVIGIDPWSAAASQEGYTGVNHEWWGQLDHDAIYRGFVGNVQSQGLQDFIEVRRQKSLETLVPPVIDMGHFDAQHTDMVSAEIKRFAPSVRVGGVVVLDDLSWNNDGDTPVLRGIELLLKSGFVERSRTKLPTGEEWGIFERREEACV